MSKTVRLIAILAAGATLSLSPAAQTSKSSQGDAALVTKAKGIHDRIIKLDTHNDIDPRNFTADCNYTMRLTTQINLR